ncbi:MAG: hypothetical protein NMNS01_17460 [Nitrosomonas sp.]|nr:MAG: hypothetical protein NMNS01_17460 [Nitrosomonas sp.]
MNKFFAYFKYALENRKILIFPFIFFIIFIIYEYQTSGQLLDLLEKSWNGDVGPLVGFATLFVATAVWVAELTEEWRNRLPKRLTVNFVYWHKDELKTVMRCEQAYLSDVADIRALGQQIGGQLAKNQYLHFRAPHVIQLEGKIEHSKIFRGHYDSQTGNIKYSQIGYFHHFTVQFTLTELPDKLKELLSESKYKCWTYPFAEENITIKKHVNLNHH